MVRRRSSPSAFARGLVRVAIALVTSLLAASYFTSLVHMAFVAHAACVEHGGFVHVQRAGAADPSLHSDSAPARTLPGDAVTADEHDHCLAGAPRPGESPSARRGLSIVLDEQAPSAPPRDKALRAFAHAEPPPPIALLLLSPKNSPPA